MSIIIILSAASACLLLLCIILLVRLHKAGRTIGNIRSKINHDLRSPLNAILGFSDLLLQTEGDNEKKKFLSAIKAGGETQLSIIDDISLSLSKKSQVSEILEKAYSGTQSSLHSKINLANEREPLILIVDDMVDNVVFLEKILQKTGFRTVSATSGEDAIKLLTEHRPDLILLDIVMPGLSGFETCARIQAVRENLDIPVIFLSAKKDEKTIIESFIYGGIDYVIKPFNSPELLARVNTHLQLKAAKEKLNTLAFTDELTGLFNRRKFMEALDLETSRAKRYSENLSFIMIDIDLFKEINDKLGHEIGDRALIRFSKIIQSGLRESDVAGRLGGEEFGIILPKTNLEQAAVVGERIRSSIEKESALPEEKIPHFTASFGISQYKPESENPSHFIQEADTALYSSKEAGRNRVNLFK